jgi:hypothetical protein
MSPAPKCSTTDFTVCNVTKKFVAQSINASVVSFPQACVDAVFLDLLTTPEVQLAGVPSEDCPPETPDR